MLNCCFFLHRSIFAIALLLRAGLVAVQLGTIPSQNIYKIILYNILDIAISVAFFGTVGVVFAFGDDKLGVIGFKPWFSLDSINIYSIVTGFSSCLIANGIITTCLAGRMHFFGFVLLNVLLSTILQPMVMHWVWHNSGWMQAKEFLGIKVSFMDYFGCLVIHIYAGTIALVGGIYLGGRLILLEEISEMSIGLESPSNSAMGYIFVIIGFIVFAPPLLSPKATVVNNLVAFGCGMLSVSGLQFLVCKQDVTYWNVLKCIQGAVAAITTVAGGVHLYSPLTTVLLASCGSTAFYFAQIVLESKSSIEDYSNVVAIHLVCGFLGLVMVPLIIMQNVTGMVFFLWHIICIFVTIAVLAVVIVLFLFLLHTAGILRSTTDEKNHQRSLVVANKTTHKKCSQRLFHLNLNAPQIEPGSRKNFKQSITIDA
ncbi:hypothetical protein PPYR_09573 [Photinus pyralis]|uniref:Ammonium transporter AmtB-like domain-containing protein n=1 Tax=Photinus pyralis TaxID=7054 RepID=A0A5N4AMK9_PHOPY|nr:hypothetical protein PPYR_09573 [Photinus pyralis]